MKQNPGGTDSPWRARDFTTQLPSLDADLQTEVCIVGGGISGMTTAYLLAREGRSVVVLDDGPIGGGETGRTTAHLSNAFDDRYCEVERLFGVRGSRLIAESHTAAIDRIEDIVCEEQIQCDFDRVDGYLFVPPDCSKEVLEREIAAARRAGLQSVEWVDRAPINDFDTGRCLRFPRQAQFDPLKYIDGLVRGTLQPNDIYNPSRLISITTTGFLNESLNVTAHYTDWLTGGEVSSTEEIKPDEGCIVRRGLTKIAASGMIKGCFTSGKRFAHTWEVSSHGTQPNKAGIVLVTALALTSWATSSTAQRTAIS
jgi:FAD dependent oxidoreductase